MATYNRINHKENIGKKFNRLTILDVYKEGKDFYYKCKCDCGTIKDIRAVYVVQNLTKSCGCLLKENSNKLMKEVGLSNRKYDSCYYCNCKKHYAKGLCRNCYNRLRRNGVLKHKNKSKLFNGVDFIEN